MLGPAPFNDLYFKPQDRSMWEVFEVPTRLHLERQEKLEGQASDQVLDKSTRVVSLASR